MSHREEGEREKRLIMWRFRENQSAFNEETVRLRGRRAWSAD